LDLAIDDSFFSTTIKAFRPSPFRLENPKASQTMLQKSGYPFQEKSAEMLICYLLNSNFIPHFVINGAIKARILPSINYLHSVKK
jgi:hypothetical protein